MDNLKKANVYTTDMLFPITLEYSHNEYMNIKENIEEIIVASDGFSELFAKELPKKEFAKHDDVSAIMISLKRKISSEPLLK